MMKNSIIFSLLLSSISITIVGISPEAASKGFVDLGEIAQNIILSPRYFDTENFTATRVDGYLKGKVLLTKQAAEALKKVQEEVEKDGYSLVVYDAYRPQQAVNHFMRWSKDVTDQQKKEYYYPRVDKARVFELGYVAERSGHSRGSTVDLTLIKKGENVRPVEEKKRTLKDGYVITMLDDGTQDMGSSFDLFDKASHYENDLIEQEHQNRRTYLKNVMEKHGFKNYAEEWWHFTLKNEPYEASKDSSYFNFPVE